MSKYRGSYHQGQYKWRNLKRGATRLSLNLAVLVGLAGLIWWGCLLFTHKVGAVVGSVVFLGGTVAWVVLIRFLRRRYSRLKPSFKLTAFAVAGVFLVLTFAGIQPLASYKDSFIDSIWASEAGQIAPVIPDATETEPEQTPSEAWWDEPKNITEAETETFMLINAVREYYGIPPTEWDDELYKLSRTHTEGMAAKGELFHSPMSASYGENAWGGQGYTCYSPSELAEAIVGGWLTSPLHKACLLHEMVRRSVVSIVVTLDGQYASWTFWTSEFGEGPELLRRAMRLWETETGGQIPWLDWLDSKGYPYNTDWLYGVQ